MMFAVFNCEESGTTSASTSTAINGLKVIRLCFWSKWDHRLDIKTKKHSNLFHH